MSKDKFNYFYAMQVDEHTVTLQQRKQALLQKLAIDYAPTKVSFFKRPPPSYLSTWQMANTPPFDEPPVKTIEIGYNKISLSLALGLMVACGFLICYLFYQYQSFVIVYIALLLFLAAMGYLLVPLVSKPPRLVLNPDGILYTKWQEAVPWHRVVSMWVKTSYPHRGEDIHTLLVHYYDERFDEFYCRKANIDGLQKSPSQIAFLLEYIKQEAGFPTTQGH